MTKDNESLPASDFPSRSFSGSTRSVPSDGGRLGIRLSVFQHGVIMINYCGSSNGYSTTEVLLAKKSHLARLVGGKRII